MKGGDSEEGYIAHFMKTIISLFIALLSTPHVWAFTDIENNWYKQSILELKELEIVNGFDNGAFLPEDHTTRAEILKIILSASDTEILEPEKSCFSDIYTSSWQAKYVCSWADLWITKWYDDGTFRPNGTITVLETLAFWARAFDLDIASLWEGTQWYEKYQAFAHINNIIPIHSYTTDTLISRWQAVEVINRMRKFADKQKLDYRSIGCEVSPDLKSWSYEKEVSWLDRNYLLYVPSGMKKWKEMKLIIAFHGRTNSNDIVRDYMKLGWGSYDYKQSDFIVAYPAGMWAWPYSWSQYENIEFFDAIITEVSEKLCIDRNAVFSVGHSLGSYMSNKVSCLRGDVIRAMAWVASDGYNGKCTGPVASLITHLPGDHLASYHWGLNAYSYKSSQNMCSTLEESTSIWDIKSCTQKTSCTPGNTVLFCNSYSTYGNDQHSWPKKGSDDILDFFREIDAK